MFINEGGCVISCADGGIFKFLTVSMCVTTPRFMTNDDQEGLASCKCLSGGTGLLPMVIRRGQPLANDDPEGPASCKWSSGGQQQ